MRRTAPLFFLVLGFFFFGCMLPRSASAASLNVVTNPGAETGDFTGWSLTSSGDNGWGISGGSYAHSGNLSFISSYARDTLSQEIDLVGKGYTASELDAAPTVNLDAFTTGHWPNAADTYRVVVELRDASHSVIASYDTGTNTEAGDNVWTEISHSFASYGSGLRYIYIREEGTGAEYWAGQYGTVFDDTSLTIGGAGPSISITAPGNGQTVSSWAPSVNWGTSTFCQYSYDGLTYTTVNCANNGSDIPETNTTLSPTLHLLGIDASGNSTVTSTSFYTQPTGNALTFGLVGYWKFDESSSGTCAGGKDACDSSGSGNDGTYSGTLTPSATVPTVSFSDPKSLSFDGTDSYVTVNRPVADDLTICAWIKTATPGNGTDHWTSAPILDAEVPGLANDFGFGVDSNGHIEYGNGGIYDATVNGSTSVADNAWHNVCATRTKTTGAVDLYVDGRADGTGSTSMSSLNGSAVARIGYGLDGTSAKHFNGLIDDLRVYQRALAPSEISLIAEGFNSSDHTPPVITLLGNANVTVAEGSVYADAGATATDDTDGTITSSIVMHDPVNTSVPGTYTVTYDVTDSSGNAAVQVSRTVQVAAQANHAMLAQAIAAPSIPAGGFQFVVNGNTPVASSPTITITSNGGSDIGYIALSTSPDFAGAVLIPYNQTLLWNICGTAASCPNGSYTVYAKMYTKWGQQSPVQTFRVTLQAKSGTSSSDAAPTSKTTPALLFTKTLSQGDSGDSVKILQAMLAKDPSVYPDGTVSGYFGKLTKKAVGQFQVKYGIALPNTSGFGVLGPRTRAKLNQLAAAK